MPSPTIINTSRGVRFNLKQALPQHLAILQAPQPGARE